MISFELTNHSSRYFIPTPEVHANFMPVTVWSVNRVSSRLIPGYRAHPGFDDIIKVSTRNHWFIYIRLQITHLTKSSLAFSITLTTMAFDQSSLWWFGITTCIASPRGPPTLPGTVTATISLDKLPHGCAFVAHRLRPCSLNSVFSVLSVVFKI